MPDDDPTNERERQRERELNDHEHRAERQILALLRQCMEGINEPFSDAGKAAAYECWRKFNGRPAVGSTMAQVVDWTFDDLYAKLCAEAKR